MRRYPPSRNDPLGDFMAMFPFILVFIGVPVWIICVVFEWLFL